MKSWKRPSELNFVVLNFMELSTLHVMRFRQGKLSRKESRDGALQCRVLRGRLPRLQSTNSVGARIPEREVLALCFGRASALFTSSIT